MIYLAEILETASIYTKGERVFVEYRKATRRKKSRFVTQDGYVIPKEAIKLLKGEKDDT